MIQLLLVLAIFPGIFLLFQVYRLDKIEAEPIGLVMKVFFLGVISTFGAMALEQVGEGVLGTFFDLGTKTALFHLIDCFLVVALAEEGVKRFVVKKIIWDNPEFDYTFDAIVYCVSASCGFAVFENILYVVFDSEGIYTAIMRAFTAVPGHIIFAIFMGYFMGKAKYAQGHDDPKGCKRNLRLSILVPVLLHGFYDFCIFMQNGWFTLLFLIFIVALEIITARKIAKFAKSDTRVDESYYYYDISMDPRYADDGEWEPEHDIYEYSLPRENQAMADDNIE